MGYGLIYGPHRSLLFQASQCKSLRPSFSFYTHIPSSLSLSKKKPHQERDCLFTSTPWRMPNANPIKHQVILMEWLLHACYPRLFRECQRVKAAIKTGTGDADQIATPSPRLSIWR